MRSSHSKWCEIAASLDMSENFLDVLYKVVYKNAGTELQSI